MHARVHALRTQISRNPHIVRQEQHTRIPLEYVLAAAYTNIYTPPNYNHSQANSYHGRESSQY